MNYAQYTFLCLATLSPALGACGFLDFTPSPRTPVLDFASFRSSSGVLPQVPSSNFKKPKNVSIQSQQALIMLQRVRRKRVELEAERKNYLVTELEMFERHIFDDKNFSKHMQRFLGIVVSKKDYAILNGTYHK